jgi:hypothetical protein
MCVDFAIITSAVSPTHQKDTEEVMDSSCYCYPEGLFSTIKVKYTE